MGLSTRRRGVSGIIGSATALLAAALLGSWSAICATVIALVLAAYLRTEGVRRRRVQRVERERRHHRREARELRVEEAGARSFVLDELADLVTAVTREAPAEASRYQLEDLLDTYAELLITRRTYERQLLRPQLRVTERTPPLQRLVRERSLVWRQTCVRRVAECKERLDELAELIRLHADRARLPEIDHLFSDDVIERQLA